MDLPVRLLVNTTDRPRSMAQLEPTPETRTSPDVLQVGRYGLMLNHYKAVKSVLQQTNVKACRPGCTLQWAIGIGGVEHKRTPTRTVDVWTHLGLLLTYRELPPELEAELERRDAALQRRCQEGIMHSMIGGNSFEDAQNDLYASDNDVDSDAGSWDEDDYVSG